jgi:murein DD-endopeptidase MepM/ murein hydrolase activator NlpD
LPIGKEQLPRVRLRVPLASSIVVAVVLVFATPAGADDPSSRRSQTKAKQAQVRGQLNLALASDAAVESRLNSLNAEVATGQNILEDARRAQGAASALVADASHRLADATTHLDQTRRQLQAVAVEAYMRPRQITALVAGFDVNEVARGQALLSVAAGSRTDALDASRQAQNDRQQAKSTMQGALATAASRTKVASDRAAALTAAQRAQQSAHAELQSRIAALQKESGALAVQQSGIEALIAARSAPGSGDFAAGPVSGTGLIWPLHGPVTSEFGPRWGGFHPGIDIAPPFGTPIHAAKAGVVIVAGPTGGYGNFVIIDHGGGLSTGYGHQSRLAVSLGQTVTQGQVIGYEGSTGASTGPHLHFEVRINGTVQNPRRFESGNP